MLPRRTITLVQQFSRLKLVHPHQIRSFTSLMPPKRSTRAKPNGAIPSAPTGANGNTPPTSMLHALAHVPPAPPGPPLPHAAEEDDDLTPPPDLSPAKPKQATNGTIGKAKKANGKGKAKAEPVEEEMTPTPSELEEKQAEVEHRVAEDIVGELKGKRRKARVSYNETAAIEGLEEDVEEEKPAKKGKSTPKKKVQDEYEPDGNISAAEDEPAMTTPKKGGKKKAVKTPVKKEDDEGDEEDGEGATPAKEKKPRKPTPKKSRLAAKDEPEFDEDGNEIVKKKRKPKVYPKIEYVIPDVPKKTTNFKGRLGYACLNTVLRTQKPDSVFCSRTCRIASIEEEGMELPKGLALMNVKDLLTMIEWNEQNNIRFLRLSSEMFPFASHAKYGYDLSFAEEGLKAAGDLANKYGHRITMHPGQFTQLGSPKPNVVTASVRELDYQCEILDRMGIDQDGVMIIHMGGIYGDKPTTLARFKENFTTRLSDKVKKRLVLENDEICYNVDDLLPVCNELEIPIIFDYHHDWINPSSEPPSVLIPKIAEMWSKRGIKMKQHLSEPRPGAESVMERRAHADRCQTLPPDLPVDCDLMIEAKDKEQAVFELYRMYDLHPVIHDNLRPPDPAPSMHTKGRKSSTKKKTKETGEVDEDGNPIQLSDVEKEADAELGDEATLAGREQSPKQEIKEELKEVETETPKRKRATKSKGKAAKSAAESTIQDVEVKPEVEEEAVNEGVEPAETGAAEETKGEVAEKAPPKKRARKSKDAPKA